MSNDSISVRSLLQYGLIALPVAFAGFPLYILAPDFYATQRGLSLTLLGSLLLALRLFDAVLDPLIGWMTDKLQGQFLPVLSVAGMLLCLSIYGLFNFVFFTPAIWFAVCTFFAVSAYSTLTIVLGAQATLWTSNRNDQTRIAGAREAFVLVGLVTAVSLPAVLGHVVSQNNIYHWYAMVLAFLMVAGGIAFAALISQKMKVQDSEERRSVSILAALQKIPKESTKLFAVYGLSVLASSIPAVLVIFYVRDFLGAEHLTGVFLLLYFLFGVVGMPFWKRLSLYMGKYSAWACSNMLAVAGFIGAYFLQAGDVWPYAIVCVASGLALGADLTLPPSILADHIHARGNAAFSATHYSFLAFIAKISLALASAIVLPALDAAGFNPHVANSDQALMALSAAYALIPCVLKLMAAGLLFVLFIRFQSGGANDTIQNLHDHRGDFHA